MVTSFLPFTGFITAHAATVATTTDHGVLSAITYANALPWVGITGLLGIVGTIIVQLLRNSDSRNKTNSDVELRKKEHQDELTFKLLEAANFRIAQQAKEISELSDAYKVNSEEFAERLAKTETHMTRLRADFEVSLVHIRNLLRIDKYDTGHRQRLRKDAEGFLDSMSIR